ncbi:MAG TPA: hypothetical protein VMH24_04680 [Candidatus Sulfotelmatobacter sp.]|nr:hypothetical protein [Candidatus Sulfotelmatobacter sp.]
MATDTGRRWAADRSPWLVGAVLLGLALVARAVAVSQVTVAPTVDSAYYVGVAGRLATGQGLTANVLWTYASPPLTVPQPAFALWMPLASLLAAVPMVLGGTTSLLAAQLPMILLGAALAPLTWYVAGQAAAANGLAGRRRATVALGSGLVAALFGPFLVAVTGPDSSVPFAVLAVAACCAMPAAMGDAPGRRWGVALGVLLGLAYLARQEAIWLGLTDVLLLGPELRRRVPAERRAWLIRALGPVVVSGAVVVAPWLVRQTLVFGSPFPGQAIENLWFTRNQDVFAFAQPPTMATFLAQGPAVIVEHILAGFWHQLIDVLILPTLPVGVFGLLGLAVLVGTPALRARTALRALTLAAGLLFVATGVLFPVATLAGTFLHASGPALVALIVLAALAADRAVAAIGLWRGWDKQNAWLASLITLAVALPLSGLEVWLTGSFATGQADREQAAATAVAAQVPDLPDGSPAIVVTDEPIGFALATGRPTLILPDEPPADVLALARRFGARAVLVFGEVARTAPSLDGAACFSPGTLPAAAGSRARLYLIDRSAACVP